ncbi:hypothetical protein BDV3_004137 [Batrachochytrium dendrobatidis]
MFTSTSTTTLRNASIINSFKIPSVCFSRDQMPLTHAMASNHEAVSLIEARRCYDKVKYRREQRKIKQKLNQDDITFDHAFSVFQTYTLGQDLPITAHIKIAHSESGKPIRGEVMFPHQVGQLEKPVVLMFATGKQAEEAKQLGVDIVGGDELIEQIMEDKITFDRCLSTSEMFPKVIKIARKLGPKGLMPSPAKGTVSDDLPAMMASLHASTKFELGSNNMIQVEVGRALWKESEVEANIKSLIGSIMKSRPSKQDVNGFVESISISAPHTAGMKLPNSKFIPKPPKALSEVKTLLESYGLLTRVGKGVQINIQYD